MIAFLYLLALISLGVFSYTQIDLNLTLLQNPAFLSFQKTMIGLGYFNRPGSTAIFVGLVLLLTLLYVAVYKSENLSKKWFAVLLAGVSLVGLFSYSGFSHDLFNYIFDARILVLYHQNPYTTAALTFPADTWIRFMQWTHRTYPYGPFWLALTAPLYAVGIGKFVLTLFWFKLFFVACYVGSSVLIYKLSRVSHAVLFALNPLVIIEGVISPHLDIAMLFFALLAYYFMVNNRKVLSLVTLILSAAIKFTTILFLPLFFIKRFDENSRLNLFILLAFIGVIGQFFSRELLPHYFLVPLGFLALKLPRRGLVTLTILGSLVLILLRYLPFFLTGSWVTIQFAL